MTKPKRPKPPGHLRAPTRAWFAHVLEKFELEEHHVRLLTRAAEMWDRGEQAREALRKNGLTFADDRGNIRPRPELAIERSSVTLFARLVRELDLDVEPPVEERSRPPALPRYRR